MRGVTVSAMRLQLPMRTASKRPDTRSRSWRWHNSISRSCGARRTGRSGALPEALRQAQQVLGRAEHLLIVYPLWLDTMPALLKAFLEQVFRPGFAIPQPDTGKRW